MVMVSRTLDRDQKIPRGMESWMYGLNNLIQMAMAFSTRSSEIATAMASLLYDVAAVSSGYEVDDPGAFAKRVVALMSGEDLAATVADAPAPAPEPEAAAAAPAEVAVESVEAEVIEPE